MQENGPPHSADQAEPSDLKSNDNLPLIVKQAPAVLQDGLLRSNRDEPTGENLGLAWRRVDADPGWAQLRRRLHDLENAFLKVLRATLLHFP